MTGLATLLSIGDPPVALNVTLPANVRQITLQTSEHTCFPSGAWQLYGSGQC
jgi:hypothetical protein